MTPVAAVGIPDRANLGDIARLEAGHIYDYILHEHDAEQAGFHADLRFGNNILGLYSWAIPKGRLPEPGEKFLAVQQPIHNYSYGTFAGRITSGYGKGDVRIARNGKILITKIDPSIPKIEFTVISERYPQRFVLVRPRGSDGTWKVTDWLIINTTPVQPLVYGKQSLRVTSPDKLEALQSRMKIVSVQPKIDGAHGLLRFGDDEIELYSYRISRIGDRPIIHTERVFQTRPTFSIPKRLRGTVVSGEIYGVYKDASGEEHVIAPNVLSALLNASPYNSLMRQLREGIELRFKVFDIRQYGANYIDPSVVPYQERRAMIRELVELLDHPRIQLMPDHDPSEATKLYQEISAGTHPLTNEGIVLYPEKGIPYKVKTYKEADVFIRRIEPGEGKYADSAGGFAYSREPHGPIVGVVGTGFDDEMRQDMRDNPQEYIGRRARVKYFEEFPSGALRAPVFLALHEDYPNLETKTATFTILDPEDPYWLRAIDRLQHLRKLVKSGASDPSDTDSGLWDWPIVELPAKAFTAAQALLGGPSPFTSLLLHNVIFGGLGYGVGELLKRVSDKFRPDVNWRMALIGAILGSIRPTLLYVYPALSEKGLVGLFEPTALQEALREAHLKAAAVTDGDIDVVDDIPPSAIKTYFAKEAAKFDVDEWGKEVLSDERLKPWEKTVLVTVPLAASVRRGDDYVTIGDVSRTAINMSLGPLFGDLLGQIIVPFLHLKPEVREYLRESGRFAGLVRSALLPVYAEALKTLNEGTGTYGEIRSSLHI